MATVKAYIKQGNKIQFVTWNGSEFSKNATTGEEVNIRYCYYPATKASVDSTDIDKEIQEIIEYFIFARLSEIPSLGGDIDKSMLYRNLYRDELIRYKSANARKDAVGRMLTYQI